jgi:DHA2 family multidrug resistance protein
MIGLVVWEWRQKNPLINLKLFRFKNFAICCFLMDAGGRRAQCQHRAAAAVHAATAGLYNATNAGMALTAGGFALLS